MITVAIVKEVNETELVATWTPSDIAVKVGDWIGVECKEQLAQEPVAWLQEYENENGDIKHTVTDERIGINDIPVYTHPAPQPAQEPVAYILRNEYNEYRLEPLDNLKITDFPIEVEVKLYTQPAPSWQGLSDDEIWNVIEGMGERPSYQETARAIEQALKEKNHG